MTVPSYLRTPAVPAKRAWNTWAADRYLEIQAANTFGQIYQPAEGRYDWGSNHLMAQTAIVVRSIVLCSGSARVISEKMGPEKVFAATVVRIVETPKTRAAFATRPALLRSAIASIDFVANAICDWWSIRMSV